MRNSTLTCACAGLVLVLFASGAFGVTAAGYRDRVVVTAPGARMAAADVAVSRALADTVVSFTFSEQPLEEAFEFLGTLGNINIVIDRRKIEAGKTVTLKLSDVPLLTAVKLVAEQAGVKWIVRDGVVMVTDEEGAKSEPVTVVYDVGDLLAVAPDYDGPTVDLPDIGRGPTVASDPFPGPILEDEPKKDSEKTRETLLDELLSLIRETIDPGTWDTD